MGLEFSIYHKDMQKKNVIAIEEQNKLRGMHQWGL